MNPIERFIIMTLVFAAIALAWYAFRRWREGNDGGA